MHKCWYKKISKNKGLEIEWGRWRDHWLWLVMSIRITGRQDHAGLYIALELIGIFLNITLYDHRHWHVKAERFYDEAEDDE